LDGNLEVLQIHDRLNLIEDWMQSTHENVAKMMQSQNHIAEHFAWMVKQIRKELEEES
jgi:hypothetical protein